MIADGNVKAEITDGQVGFGHAVRCLSDNRAGVVLSVDDNGSRNGEFVTAGRSEGQLFDRRVKLGLGIHQYRVQPLGFFLADKADGKSVVLVVGFVVVLLDVREFSEVLLDVTVPVLVRSGFVQMEERYVVVIINRIVVSDVVVEDCKSVLGEQERFQFLGVIRDGRIGARGCGSLFRIVDIDECIRCGIVDVVEQRLGDQRIGTGIPLSVHEVLGGGSVAVQQEYRPVILIDIGVNNLLVKHVECIVGIASDLHGTDLAVERMLGGTVLVGQKDVAVLQRVGCVFINVNGFRIGSGFVRFHPEHGRAAKTVQRCINALEHLVVRDQIGLSVLFAPQIAGAVLHEEVIGSFRHGNLHVVAVLLIQTDDLSAVIIGIGCGKTESVQLQNPVLGICRSEAPFIFLVIKEQIILTGRGTRQCLKADCRLIRVLLLLFGNEDVNRETGERGSAGFGKGALVGLDRLRLAVDRDNVVRCAGLRVHNQIQLTVDRAVLFHHIINRCGRFVHNEGLNHIVQIKIQRPVCECNGCKPVLH